MSEDLFHPRVAAPSAEADRPPGGDEPIPQPDDPASVANAPTLPLPPKPAASPDGDGAGKPAEQRIQPAVPVAQLRRALDSFYATHANDADSDDAPSSASTKAKPSALPPRKRGSAGPKAKPSTAPARGTQSSIPSPRTGQRPETGSGSIAKRPPSAPTARAPLPESLAEPEKPAKPAKPPKPVAQPKPAPEAGPASPAPTVQPAHPTRSAHPGRRRAMRLRTRPSLRWWLIAGALALILAGSAAVLGANLGGHKSTPPPPTAAAPAPPANSAAVSAAVTWIIRNVGTEHVIACDVTVCGLLRTQGFPATSLITVRNGIADVEQADVVVNTALLRQLAGPRLTSVEASQPLAVFGVNAQLTVVQTVALVGPAQYGQQLSADLASRIQAGAALLQNPRLVLSPGAETLLTQGMVDSRICSLLALLVGGHTITVASFLTPGPGAGPDIPSAGLVISQIDGQPAGGTSPSAVALRSLLSAQQSPYEPLSVGPAPGSVPTGTAPPGGTPPAIPPAGSAPTGSGAAGLEILYAQPGPLGLLGGGIQ